MISKLMLFQVDSFTDVSFKGNPAGVCLLNEERSAQWMQSIAKEMNLSETAFVRKGEGFIIRYFTPTVEVDLCGHATLASAHILFGSGIVKEDETIDFHAKAGLLKASLENGWIKMDFPADSFKPVDVPEGLGKSLHINVEKVFKSGFGWFIVELKSPDEVKNLKPDFRIMREFNIVSVLVTARSDDPQFDFVSRFFAPGIGIDEDPVTGSAHCTLGPYWQYKLGKSEMVGKQLSERGGIVKVQVAGDRVKILGQAVTIFEADLMV